MAEWTLVGANDLGITTYVDLDTIHKAGNTFKMWSLYDYKIAGAKVLSMKSWSKYDCEEEQTITLAYSQFSGNMGAGFLVYSDGNPSKWEPVAPGSIGETEFKIACSKQ